MRIGTWNLEGRWSDAHASVIDALACDVLLLTEVARQAEIAGYRLRRSGALMSQDRHWSVVVTREAPRERPDPHPASVAVELAEAIVCCSVLPWLQWRPGPGTPPWTGGQAERMSATVGTVRAALDGHRSVIWGGDWNTPLAGPLTGFSRSAQGSVLDAVDALGLVVPTAEFASARPGCRSIDHIAVPRGAEVRAAEAVPVPERLSDHWAYAVDVVLEPR